MIFDVRYEGLMSSLPNIVTIDAIDPIDLGLVLDAGDVVELVHGVVLPPSQQGRVSREVVLVVVTNVGSGHVLVFHTVQTFSDLTTLDSADIGKHGVRAKVSSDKRITNVKQDKKVFKVAIS